MSESFIDYLNSIDEKYERLAKKPSRIVTEKVSKNISKPIQVKKEVSKVTESKIISKNSMTVCNSCGWHMNVILENCAYCPKCGRASLKFINENIKNSNKPNLNEIADHANAILDDDIDSTNYNRPTVIDALRKTQRSVTESFIKPEIPHQISPRSEIADHASDLLDGIPDSPMNFIPMPDFSQFEKKHLQLENTQVQPPVEIPKELQLVQVNNQIDEATQRQMQAMGLI